MEATTTGKYIVPNPRIPRTLGILNIVFAAGLMLCGLCMGGYLVILPVVGNVLEQVQKKEQAQRDANRKGALEALEADEKAAKTEEEKTEIQTKRRELASQPKAAIPITMDLKKMGLSDRKIQAYAWTDLATGLLLNVMMLTAGIGLLRTKMWGLKLALWVAALKIVRLFVFYTYATLAVLPDFCVNYAKFVVEMIVQTQGSNKPLPPNLSVEVLARLYTIWFSVIAVAIILIGIIYPVIELWLLNRSDVRAAFSGTVKPVDSERT